ncbi:MAG TPA: DUF4097 family beta strand repeat-containing protein [Candidatus Acidoferrales bacterium]|nr:DUF4097 family beta strand repeat-containing protein [Candidatus Acidoferrales bacterium]
MKNAFQASVMCTLAAGLLLASPALARGGYRHAKPNGDSNHVTADKTGQLTTRSGLRLHLITDIGNVKIKTQDSETVDYHVHLETEASGSEAKEMLENFVVATRNTPDGVILSGRAPQRHWGQRMWVTFEVSVPREYSVDVSTEDGSIETGDLNGRAVLVTNGGNITAGNISGSARVSTDGGNVVVKDVAEELSVTTGGGNISAGNVGGPAVLRTGGGMVRLGSVGGVGRIETGAGNIYVGRSTAGLATSTGGGQIEIGEAAGLVRAQTGGGGIRIVRSVGPTRLDTGSGMIYLTQAENAVHATTGAGGITAWFGRDAKLSGPCRLEAGEGDIVVYLPKMLAVTVDAQIELGGNHRVIVDPAFPLKVTYGEADEGGQAVRAEGSLNGGGSVLELRTVSGNIRLVLNDAENEKKQMELFQQEMEKLKRQLGVELLKLKLPTPPPQNEP